MSSSPPSPLQQPDQDPPPVDPPNHPESSETETLTLESDPSKADGDSQIVVQDDDDNPDDPDPVPTPSPRAQDPNFKAPAHTSTSSRRGAKNRKAALKRRAMERKSQQKLELLVKTFKPIPFAPVKALDFSGREDLLQRLGLWEFVRLDFDRALHGKLIAQLVASFSKSERCSYVNGVKIRVSRADLARALKLPAKRVLAGAEGAGESPETDESVGFVLDLVSNWMLLHDDDTWMMPDEIMNWHKLIREGSLEKVDWAGMVWFMVEKELMQAPRLENCYYASHLQCLIRSQRKELLSAEEVEVKDVDEDAAEEVEVKDVDEDVDEEVEVKDADGDAGGGDVKMSELEEQSLELSLGQENADNKADEGEKEGTSVELGPSQTEKFDAENEENGQLSLRIEEKVEAETEDKTEVGLVEEKGIKTENDNKETDGFYDVMDSQEFKEEDGEGQSGQWLLDGKNISGEHFLQRCRATEANEMRFDVDQKGVEGVGVVGEEQEDEELEEDEDEDEDEEETNEEEQHEPGGFNMSPKFGDLERLPSSNLLHVLESAQISFNTGMQLHDDSCGEFLASRADSHMGPSSSSIFGNVNKREIDTDNDRMHHQLNGGSKRMRTDGSWDGKSLDFNMCMEQVQQWVDKARIAHEAKEQAYVESGMNHQIFLSELQRRDTLIEHLQKTSNEEIMKKKMEIYRVECELYMMVNLLDGYKKALKETDRKFAEYRARCPQLDEPLYKDVPGSGGLVLSIRELEKQRLKQEEEEKMKLLAMKEKIEEFESVFTVSFEARLERITLLNNRLHDVEKGLKHLKDSVEKRKASEAAIAIVPPEEHIPEISIPADAPMEENIPEATTAAAAPTEEKLSEVPTVDGPMEE